ncbi:MULTISPECIES: MazG nucleotide pyrophosphohydrolase domain-containing protein [unclassified Gemella]|uniref:MazG nucleotide pyrophosphohydrolase domain-containing protein n=1 Tax=unclassified Gemella TaxID=2624949 RepID=UPI001D16EA52|nr:MULTISPECIES: MazG nucleotide pyrophosphohydrolase domain-containing protein [unclassified Gemella]
MRITIEELENYLESNYSGFNDQSLFMKLIEEVGEVAEVLNKLSGRKLSEDTDLKDQLGNELADVIHYAVGIAAVNGINLNKVILEKDKIATKKYNRAVNLEEYIKNIRNK